MSATFHHRLLQCPPEGGNISEGPCTRCFCECYDGATHGTQLCCAEDHVFDPDVGENGRCVKTEDVDGELRLRCVNELGYVTTVITLRHVNDYVGGDDRSMEWFGN